MPHMVILYTPQVEPLADMAGLCRVMADALLGSRDEHGQPVFPVGGTRVFAMEARHSAVADGSHGAGFIYFQLRMARGRSAATHAAVGQCLRAAAAAHLQPLLAAQAVGLTLQIDEGHEVFDAKFGNLHALFAPSGPAPTHHA
ncbi:MAG: 5-carboxymethyl-2-hydroxymuconate isomerase [Rubrivivax sp.]|jgi:5-carboxymethyl-2-hydroxymuconate isomerase|nr:5-carboxymethyl-2-hydroxymuconate Delta-isomerase [Rubrivivax sp.]